MSKARPSLNALFAKKDSSPPPPPETAAEVPQEGRKAPTKAKAAGEGTKDARKPIIVRLDPIERRGLKEIAAATDTTVQDMAAELLRDLLRRHGKPTSNQAD